MSKTPKYDAKISQILDSLEPGERTCSITGEKWIVDEDEVAAYRKFQVPPSKYSPLSRQKILCAHFNGGQWWYNKHAETGKPMVTTCHPSTGVRVLPDEEWFDKDFQSINQEVDLDISFFDQLYDLRLKIPVSGTKNFEKPENSICIASYGDQNSFFVVASKSKDTFYSIVALETESAAEVYNSKAVTNSNFVIHGERIFSCQYALESRDCLNCDFVFDCRSCEYCFGASNKRNKKYLWFNEQLTQEEWEKRRAEVDLGSRKVAFEWRDKFYDLVNAAVWPENFNEKCENSTGEYLTNTTDCKMVYYANGGAKNELHTTWSMGNAEGNAFCANPSGSQDSYLTAATNSSNQCKHAVWCMRCQNLEYCSDCYDCENCFGCVGLRHKKFCILNKQYSEDEYWSKLDEIKCNMLESDEYGEPMQTRTAVGYFMETGSVRYFKADAEFGQATGAHMFEPNTPEAIGDELMKAMEVVDSKTAPDSCDDLDDWVGKAMLDSGYNRRYAYLKQEVDLYQRLRIAPPVEHHVKRISDMVDHSCIGVFSEANCAECKTELIISMNPKFSERKIYCKPCYLKYLEQYG